jgi:hypothetical protein
MVQVIKLIMAVVSLAAAGQVNAALPSCWPKELNGTGSAAVIGDTATQQYLGWTCPHPTPGMVYTISMVRLKSKAVKNVGWTKINTIEAASKYWDLNVKEDSRLPKYREGYTALCAALGVKPNYLP